ncbi:MAG: uncharacterized protein A8A55_3315, partial [Amphiamblys sp. WSBS2006]
TRETLFRTSTAAFARSSKNKEEAIVMLERTTFVSRASLVTVFTFVSGLSSRLRSVWCGINENRTPRISFWYALSLFFFLQYGQCKFPARERSELARHFEFQKE